MNGIYEEITWHTPPENQGQMIVVSYGCDDDGSCWVRTEVLTENKWVRKVEIRYIGELADFVSFDPWNAAPELRPELRDDVEEVP